MNGLIGTLRSQAGLVYGLGRRYLTGAELSPVRFVIFGRGRSGSTALVHLMNAIPDVHCDGEILRNAVALPRASVLARCANAGTPVYGCKVLSYQILNVQPLRDRTGFIRRLHGDNFKILYLKRENLVEHAVSNIRARAFGFHSRQPGASTQKIAIDAGELLRWIEGS